MSSQQESFFLLFLILSLTLLTNTVSDQSVLPDFPCRAPNLNHYPFCNISLSTAQRAQSLVSLLTLPEKIQQLSNNASSVPRLGIPAYQWWSESLHGLATNGPGVSFDGSVSSATIFPQVILSAASFNRTLWFDIAAAVAVEARAMYNVGQAGLTFWAPNINVFRDPRWGRGQETPGEEPLVVSDYSVEYVRGLQGGGSRGLSKFIGGFGKKRDLMRRDGEIGEDRIMLSACCKHFTAYDLDMWKNVTRYIFNAQVTKQDMEDTYQPPFRTCIQQGKASCLMCSYNAVNGVPACARADLLQQARRQWGFRGYITSDCDAVATVYDYQKYTKTAEDAVANVIKAGVDIDCGTFMLRNMQSAVDQGKVSEQDIDEALMNLFSVQIRLGLFDGDPTKGPFGELGPKDICTLEHRTLAQEAVRQGIVLLKNDRKFLPLNKDSVSSLAVIGPMAGDGINMGGGYSGIPCENESIYKSFKAYVSRTSYATGCLDVSCDSDSEFNKAVAIAKEADFVIIVAGIDLSQEREDHDRVSLLLPGKQTDLVSSVAAASKKPVILVLTGGGPVDVSFAQRDPRIASILWIGYPGEAGGRALAEIVFGEINPGGRLPITWYPEAFTNVPMTDMHMRPDASRGHPGRTYRFHTGDKVYSFGHGLSYTNFTYMLTSAPSNLPLTSLESESAGASGMKILQVRPSHVYVDEVLSCDLLRFFVNISVTNMGEMDGGHVVLLFSRPPKTISGAPQKQLLGFERVYVAANHVVETSFLVDPCRDLSFADEEGKRVIPLGDHVLEVGDLEHVVSVGI